MTSHIMVRQVLGILLLASASAYTAAQTGDAAVPPAAASKQAREIAQGDPARWYREDTTIQQRLRTRQKEIGAALVEAKAACRQAPAAERQACLKMAQATWQEEKATLRTEQADATAPARQDNK